MSVQATTWVWENAKVDDPRKLLVLLAVADAANRDGSNSFPGVRTIARYARCSERTVQRCLRELEADGHIVVTKSARQHAPITYSVRMVADVTPDSSGDTDGTSGTGDESSSGGTGVTSENARGDTAVTNADSSPSIEQEQDQQEPSSSAAYGADVVRLCSLLADLVEANGSKPPTVTKRWLEECDRLLRLDGRTPDQVERAIRWSQADPFWRANVLSMPALRAKYDRLRLAASRPAANGHRETDAGRLSVLANLRNGAS